MFVLPITSSTSSRVICRHLLPLSAHQFGRRCTRNISIGHPNRAFSSSSRSAKMTDPLRPRRFLPLDPARKSEGVSGNVEGANVLEGVIFDVDGTLCEPQNYMFGEMRSALGITKATDILDHIYSLPASEQDAAMEKIRDIERRAMVSQKAQPGLVTLMDYLASRSIRKGICTRNFDAPVTHLLDSFLPKHDFTPIITREFKPPKPDPAGILHIAKEWGLAQQKGDGRGRGTEGVIMVGDSVDDMTAGYKAGAATVLLVNEVNAHLAEHEHTDLIIKRLDELIPILEKGFVGRVGQGEENQDTRGQAESALREE